MNLNKIEKIIHICIDSFSEISILSIPVLIYLFFIVIRIYSGNFTEIALEMSLMSIIYYSDSVLIAKRINHNTWNVAINVILIVLIIFASSLFTLELLANGTKTAALVFQKKSGAYVDMQIANIILIIGGFIANLVLRIVVRIQGNVVGE
ncbi:hypothetical protein [Acidithiobacillus sp. HP-11]|uniref:hypothetical protein n=1 Tax=Acidithiobacillus sp. HP-11 TaxID=2697656 RepID=UPI00187AAF29|nr:hypothetical protein [Acidithiobacillus sp. HP-11]MBE7566669.1 hypothetical protein [Acidithiobacillus sp. HP-11]